jgi:hypothetical protein
MTRPTNLKCSRFAGCLIGLVLIVGCGGGRPHDRTTPRTDPIQQVGTDTDQPGYPSGARAASESAADQAVRDLGLVDADRRVRIATASGEAGLLSLEQFRVAILDQNPSVRLAALEGLDLPCEATRMPYLKEVLNDPVAAIREAVVERLGACPDPRAIALLLEARGDENPRVREEALEALYRLTGRADAGV